MVIPHMTVSVELVMLLYVLFQTHPLFSTGMEGLEIYGRLIPKTSGKPVNWTPPLTEDCLINIMLFLLVVRYSVINYSSFSGGISSPAVEWTSQQWPSNPWDHNSYAIGYRPLKNRWNSGICIPATSDTKTDNKWYSWECTWECCRASNSGWIISGRLLRGKL